MLVLHLVGHFMCVFIENYARNNEHKISSRLKRKLFLHYNLQIIFHIRGFDCKEYMILASKRSVIFRSY
jgi:hypothetical protein